MFFLLLHDSKKTKHRSSNQEASQCSGKITVVASLPCCTLKCAFPAISCGMIIFDVPSMLFVSANEFSMRVTKITSRISVSWTHSLPFWYLPLFWLNEMSILSKVHNPDNFESQSSLKLSFTNIQGLHSNFVWCESFLE